MMNKQFNATVKTENGYMNFYFNKIYHNGLKQYHVSVMGRDNKAIIFYMEEKRDGWVIINKSTYPYWLQRIETKMAELILQQSFF